MNKRQLGKTDINLTAIGFGGAPLGNLFENLDERNCYDILEKSYEKKMQKQKKNRTGEFGLLGGSQSM